MRLTFQKLHLRYRGSLRPLIDVTNLHQDFDGLTLLAAPSGCGKTSWFRLLCGWFQDGSVHDVVSHAEISLSAFDDFDFVGGHNSLFPWVRVGQNIRMRSGSSAVRAKEELLAFGCESSIVDLYPYELSQGMYKRVELVAALLRKPKVLLLDEVFSSIDPVNRQRAFERIAVLRNGAPTIISSHVEIDAAESTTRMEFEFDDFNTITGIAL